jgi:hypothetical protein
MIGRGRGKKGASSEPRRSERLGNTHNKWAAVVINNSSDVPTVVAVPASWITEQEDGTNVVWLPTGDDFDSLQSQGAADSLQWDYEVDAEQFKSAVPILKTIYACGMSFPPP